MANNHVEEYIQQAQIRKLTVHFPNGHIEEYEQCVCCVRFITPYYVRHIKDCIASRRRPRFDSITYQAFLQKYTFQPTPRTFMTPENFLNDTFNDGYHRFLNLIKNGRVHPTLQENFVHHINISEPLSQRVRYYVIRSHKTKRIYVGSTCNLFRMRMNHHIRYSEKVEELLNDPSCTISILGFVDVEENIEDIQELLEWAIVETFAQDQWKFINVRRGNHSTRL